MEHTHHGLFVKLAEHDPSNLSVCFSVFCFAHYGVNSCLRYACAHPSCDVVEAKIVLMPCQRTDRRFDFGMMRVNGNSV